ncbi:MAG: hypothetical protein JWO11_987, partial [Nocardioides sp.]|nr:hypothetical protein [Nocardioides sp.]
RRGDPLRRLGDQALARGGVVPLGAVVRGLHQPGHYWAPPTWSLDSYRARHLEFRVLDVPSLQYLMVDGHGDPNTASEYADAIGALYPITYQIKFASKQELGRDYVVPPLGALVGV